VTNQPAGQPYRRLPHGYTNESWADDDGIHKHYVGIGAQARMRAELDALRTMANLVPTPQVLAVDENKTTVTFARVAGRHGQELIDEGQAAAVLHGAGRTLRRLHVLAEPDGSVVVHGDYGPQNLLFAADSFEIVAVLDWEFAHRGRPVEDLAWAEWIVRMHHPAAVPKLTALFDGYGDRPAWADRHAVMFSRCENLRAAAEQGGNAKSQALWSHRLGTTSAWRE
jgi:aminoglycoside phosphotransferase (APT) family kinase protein